MLVYPDDLYPLHSQREGKGRQTKKGQTNALTWPAFLRKEMSLRAPSPSILLKDTPPTSSSLSS